MRLLVSFFAHSLVLELANYEMDIMITQSTVFEEVSFTLTLHNFSKEEIKNKVEGILKI
jgi:energy-coupling factor transporter ATP-binding protein EcfA2